MDQRQFLESVSGTGCPWFSPERGPKMVGCVC